MPDTHQEASPDRYMVVPRSLIFITRGEKVLLLRGAKTKRLWAGYYNGVGGHIEQGEDILSSAKRELFEETGLTATRISLCGVLTVDTGNNPGVCVFIFKGEFTEGELIRSSEGELEWINPVDLADMPVVADLPGLLSKILSIENGSPPFIAHSEYDQYGNLRLSFA